MSEAWRFTPRRLSSLAVRKKDRVDDVNHAVARGDHPGVEFIYALGGTLAGFTGAVILPSYGWRALFFVGGALPLLLAALLWKVLPESPRYLARHRARWTELAALLRHEARQVEARIAAMLDRRQARPAQEEIRTAETTP